MAVVSAGRPESANNPIDLLEEFVSANDWRFDRTTDAEMVVELRGSWCDYRLYFVWQEDLGAVYFSCLFDVRIPPNKRANAYHLLALINEKLWLGHFDLCSEELVPMFRHTMLRARRRAASRPSSSRMSSTSPSANASASSRPFSSCCGAVRLRKRHWQRPCWRPSARPEVS